MDGPPDATLDAVKHHHAVVEDAWKSAPACVPFRFGQWFADEATLLRRTEEEGEELARTLERVRGCGELSVRVLDPERPAPGDVDEPRPASGRAYLDRVRRRIAGDPETAAGAEVVRTLSARVGPLALEERVEKLGTRHGVVSVTHLVRTTDTEAYLDAVGRVRDEVPKLRFLVSGPWPPYTFGP